MTMSKPPAMVEDLNYTLTDDGGNKGTLTLAWEDVTLRSPSGALRPAFAAAGLESAAFVLACAAK